MVLDIRVCVCVLSTFINPGIIIKPSMLFYFSFQLCPYWPFKYQHEPQRPALQSLLMSSDQSSLGLIVPLKGTSMCINTSKPIVNALPFYLKG